MTKHVAAEDDLPEMGPRRGSSGLPLSAVEVVSADADWPPPSAPIDLRLGEPVSETAVRRALHDLTATGQVADVRAEELREGTGVRLRFVVTPSRVVADVRTSGSLDASDALRASGVVRGRSTTKRALREAERIAKDRARRAGYPAAKVRVTTRATDDARRVVVVAEGELGDPLRLAGVRLEVRAKEMPPLVRELVRGYGASEGDVADDEELDARDHRLRDRLQADGFFRADVRHRTYVVGEKTYLLVEVTPGSQIRIQYWGNKSIDASTLDDAVDIEKEPEKTPARIAQKVKDAYRKLGFLDVLVTAEERGDEGDALRDLVVTVREEPRVRVVRRAYPCLAGPFSARRLDKELDSFLEEDLPGATLVGPVDPEALDKTLGPTGEGGYRKQPLELSPRHVYAPDTYDRALKHIVDLYRAEGYLHAVVGPMQVVRRTCDPKGPAGTCRPLAVKDPEPRCAVDPEGLPVEEKPLPPELACKPNPALGIRCDHEISLRIPVQPGPQTRIWDLGFDGEESTSEEKLADLAELSPGDPASNVAIEDARRRILNHYLDEGFAFAEVKTELELSPDKRRARVRFLVEERQRVKVARIVLVGNERTQDRVILARLRFAPGDLYRQRDKRRSEELLATLGVFSSVTIGMEDPQVLATEKTIVVTMVERNPQYLELRPGLSTGEGVRGLLEYGHRNVLGRAIQFTSRVSLNYLPSFLIPDAQVRQNFEKLPLGQRLERRNTVGVQFPNIFHPTLRLGIDVVDVRTNSRDFGLTKDAIIPALTWTPVRTVTGTLSSSVELNNVGIFSGESVQAYLLQQGISGDLSRLLRVPDGETTAVAQRATVAWDRRDNPLGATRGTLLAGSLEHVHAFPASDNPQTISSDFLRMSGKVGVYVPFTKEGLSLAMVFGAGYNQQLTSTSKTYPDRLFFLGGVDSVRGFSRDALVPQDVADKIVADQGKPSSDPTKLTIDKIAIRGGDVFVNPRSELRVPLRGSAFTAFFVDAGNLWVEPGRIEPTRLRYAGGTGLRLATPIGPLAFDYGINLTRRAWEDFGAFHFSVGLFLSLRRWGLADTSAPWLESFVSPPPWQSCSALARRRPPSRRTRAPSPKRPSPTSRTASTS